MLASKTRREYERLFARLAEMGFARAADLFARTPREIEWEIGAFSAQQARRAEELTCLAWLTGRYAALGVHAPRRYPAAPPAARKRAAGPEAMKQAFAAMAERRNENDP
ncbi:MAG TPA: hypothetical protein IAA75_00785 [Candidatus Pullichristensenella avicola]|nr:hypothetical protein [Candidatus Pullichristensenella avicola]